MIDSSSIFKNFIRVERKDMSLLGSPILMGKAQDQAIQRKIEELKMVITRLSLLQSHDVLVLLKNSLSLPKLLYLLRTADCSGNMLC